VQPTEVDGEAINESRDDNAAAISAQKIIAQDSLQKSQENFSKSLVATIEQFCLDQRAWAGMTRADVHLVTGESFAYKLEIKNTGKTPAPFFCELLIILTGFPQEPWLRTLFRAPWS